MGRAGERKECQRLVKPDVSQDRHRRTKTKKSVFEMKKKKKKKTAANDTSNQRDRGHEGMDTNEK